MKIIVDENIPFGREAFGRLGDVVTMHGRKMNAAAVRDADLLIIRSITKVNRDLLEGSRVRFVGTCTIGTDHVNEAYLRERGITFASAPGCNANSVAEYVVCSLLVLAKRGGYRLEGKSIGVVGVGNVGSKVVVKCEAIGMRVLQNDPPLARLFPCEKRFLPLEALMDSDFITLHVPLTKTGEDKTWHMADAAFLKRMKPGAVLLNTCRGAVLDSAAALRWIATSGRDGNCAAAESRPEVAIHPASLVLDVWEGEPDIAADLVAVSALGTPHIAGYSYDGKVSGTTMVYQAACEFLRSPPLRGGTNHNPATEWRATNLMPPSPHASLTVDATGRSDEDALREAALTVYDIKADDRRLRAIADLPANERGAYFDRLRKEYPQRREFQNSTITLRGGSVTVRQKLAGIGFKLKD
ncbi:MAG: 4-phosphoerythronate dehydrogenase [Verrucomicrobia bacterium]|nr:4-phosphoerythronate dehydrogenase [Verrucomicrobiota bacterium]